MTKRDKTTGQPKALAKMPFGDIFKTSTEEARTVLGELIDLMGSGRSNEEITNAMLVKLQAALVDTRSQGSTEGYIRGAADAHDDISRVLKDPDARWRISQDMLGVLKEAKPTLELAVGQSLKAKMTTLFKEFGGLMSNYYARQKQDYQIAYGREDVGELMSVDPGFATFWATVNEYNEAFEKAILEPPDYAPITAMINNRFKVNILEESAKYIKPGQKQPITDWRRELGEWSLDLGKQSAGKKVLALLHRIATATQTAPSSRFIWMLRPECNTDNGNKQFESLSTVYAKSTSGNKDAAAIYISKLERAYRDVTE